MIYEFLEKKYFTMFVLVHCNHQFQFNDSLLLCICLLFTGKFTMFANITETAKGFPRITHDGHTYGRKKAKNSDGNKYFEDTTYWMCTKNVGKRRCPAMLETKKINGFIMMHERKTNHICKLDQNYRQWVPSGACKFIQMTYYQVVAIVYCFQVPTIRCYNKKKSWILLNFEFHWSFSSYSHFNPACKF